jgi:hypothetical protein
MRGVLACLLLLCLVESVRAEQPWHAPAGCPDQDDAEEQLRSLHSDPELLEHGNARVYIDTASTGELRARVTLRHGERAEQRVLYDRSCAALAEAAVLVISLSFEGEHAQPPPVKRAPIVRSPRRLLLAGLARVDGGSLPSPTLGVGGTLRLNVGRFTSELEGAWYLPRDHERDGARGRFGLAAGAARACYSTAWPVFAPCAAIELGQLGGRADGTDVAQQARGLWAAALLGASFAFGPYRRFSPILDAELGFPFQRAAFDVAGVGTLFEPRSVIARASLRLAVELVR